MIVLKHNDTVYIAKSCWGMRDPEARKEGIPDIENLCIWHPKKKKNRLVATDTCGRFTDIVRYEDVFPPVLDQKHLVLASYERMHAMADRFGLCNGAFLPARMAFAEDDVAYVMYCDGAVLEVEGIFSMSAEDEAVMALYDLKGADDPIAFFKEAYRTIETICSQMMFPVSVMNTKSNKIEVIHR